MSYDTEVVIAPAGEPIHLDAAKLHCGVYDTDRDALFPKWITDAREDAESRTSRQLLHARYTLTLDEFPRDSLRIANRWVYCGIIIPHAPLVSVASVSYIDGAGAPQTIASSNYVVSTSAVPGHITPVYAYSWPTTRCQAGAVTVTYNAGYASRFVADATANTLTVTGPVTWAVDAPVRLSNSGGATGALPAPLVTGTTYYIKTASSGVYTLSATLGGAEIDLTDTGTGTHFIGEVPAGILDWMLLQVGTRCLNREGESVVERGQMTAPQFVDGLLDRFRVWLP